MVNKMNIAVAASKAKCTKFTNDEVLTGLGIITRATEFSQKWVDLFDVKIWMMMMMCSTNGLQSVPAHSLSWPSAILKIFDVFYPTFLQMKVKKRMITGGGFQVQLKNLT